jgi:hypothetical protein
VIPSSIYLLFREQVQSSVVVILATGVSLGYCTDG